MLYHFLITVKSRQASLGTILQTNMLLNIGEYHKQAIMFIKGSHCRDTSTYAIPV